MRERYGEPLAGSPPAWRVRTGAVAGPFPHAYLFLADPAGDRELSPAASLLSVEAAVVLISVNLNALGRVYAEVAEQLAQGVYQKAR